MKQLPLVSRLYYKLFERERYGKYKKVKDRWREQIVITNWNTEEGRKRLMRSRNGAFFRIAHHYQPQINPFYCSIACIVTTLNSLRLAKGKVPDQKGFNFTKPDGSVMKYCLYSQLTVLNKETDKIKVKEVIAPSINPKKAATNFNPGLCLKEVADILKLYDAKVKPVMAEYTLQEGCHVFRTVAKSILQHPEKILICNFFGRVKGMSSGGHYSVIGAYDEETDSVLVMDTAAHKNPWYWVAVKHLYKAMHTKDGKNYRGWIVVSD
jgi:hypothetical protein